MMPNGDVNIDDALYCEVVYLGKSRLPGRVSGQTRIEVCDRAFALPRIHCLW